MIYEHYFSLNQRPFSIAPNPQFLYAHGQYQEALAVLEYGMLHRGGFILLTGEVGTGKTTLCKHVLQCIPQNTEVALILHPQLDRLELLRLICKEFALAISEDAKEFALIEILNDFLLSVYAKGGYSVLMIDEAQHLDADVLELIRLLTNLETHSDKLLQIILLGQPELNVRLAKYELRQLNQRFSARYHLQPLNFEQVRQYIEHRLQVAGQNNPLFSWGALLLIHRLSGGIPRLINLLADRCLMGCYGQNQKIVNVFTVRQAAKEVLPSSTEPRGLFKAAVKITLLGCAVLLTGLFLNGTSFKHSFNANDFKRGQDVSLFKQVESVVADVFEIQTIPVVYEPIKQGDEHGIIPFVRDYLSENLNENLGYKVSGGLNNQLQNGETWAVIHPDVTVIKNDIRYDILLMDSVKSFQTRHGLLVDGVLGRRTLLAMGLWDQFLLGGL